jgi:Translation elongation factors (GTPases)
MQCVCATTVGVAISDAVQTSTLEMRQSRSMSRARESDCAARAVMRRVRPRDTWDVIATDSRRGSPEHETHRHQVVVLVPLSECSDTSVICGRRLWSRGVLDGFDSYAEVPKAVADEIIQKGKGD